MKVLRVAKAGNDLAVLYNDWSLVGKGADGAEVMMNHKAIEVVRRQSDESWRFALDDPSSRG
jgi:ketosteroid isomerase-like protein